MSRAFLRQLPGPAVAVAVATLLTLAACPSSARADDAAAMSELVQYVEVPEARALAVHDELGLLVVGHREADRARLAVFELDEQGAVRSADEPGAIELPRPEALSDYRHEPLALTFHPELPMLYVWQDIAGFDDEADDFEDTRETVYEQFHHLLVFEADDEGLTLEGEYLADERLAFGQDEAALSVSRDGERLFLPNFYGRKDGNSRWRGGIGYFDLDEHGRLEPVPIPVEDSLDGRGINEFEMKLEPTFVYIGFRRRYVDNEPWRYMHRLPTRPAFAPTRRVVIFGTRTGIGLWDTQNRQQALSEINVAGLSGGDNYVAGHPRLPLIYASAHNGHGVLRIEHVEGFPTLLPELTEVGEAESATFRSAPVVIDGEHHGLAIGSADRTHLLALDDAGRLTGDHHALDTPSPGPVRALAYSPRHDRLYVAVESLPAAD